ncbi:Replication factor C subunit 3 [Araneus ventricosus]|uniref:Replication factor C subunit 3 n=1 Tax=Araneus ventricosus TaxID=182803 RepID=A0A4Y2NVQ1_ARAVE|nr:Replication factor C subunit 3 [Araneus ventricosus]
MSSLWVDKHRPKSFAQLDYHKEQANHLKKLVNSGDFPHILLYGPPGAGKKTRVMCLLRELYGAGVEKLRIEHQIFETPSKRKVEVITIASNYHIEVNPSDVGIYDRVVIQELLKTVAQTHQLDSHTQKEFKVVVLMEVDKLTKDAQHALRRTMEKYMATCRIILCCNSSSKVIPAIRSRCLGVRVAAPSLTEIATILQNICRKECLSLPAELAQRIAEKSNRNLRRAILMCEACRVQQYPFSPEQEIVEPDWEVFLRDTANFIAQEQSPKRSELLAIEAGLEAILNENNYRAVWILSDSRSSIQHLKDWNNVGDRTSISILKLLRHIGVDHEVHLQWIPSHVDIYGNEVADNLAKQGTAEPLCSTPSLTFDEIYSIRKNKDLKTWRVPPSHDWYKRSSPGGSIGLSCDRADQTALSRFVSGHLRSCSFSHGNKVFPVCAKCGVASASPEHILSCLRLSRETFETDPLLALDFLRVSGLMDGV